MNEYLLKIQTEIDILDHISNCDWSYEKYLEFLDQILEWATDAKKGGALDREVLLDVLKGWSHRPEDYAFFVAGLIGGATPDPHLEGVFCEWEWDDGHWDCSGSKWKTMDELPRMSFCPVCSKLLKLQKSEEKA